MNSRRSSPPVERTEPALQSPLGSIQPAIWAAALLLAGLACSAPVGLQLVTDVPDSEVVDLAAAGTVAAASTETAAAAPPTTQAPEATDTPEPPSPTPTITLTATLEPARASLTGDTNCRTGPLVVYDLITTYPEGKLLDITGRSASSDYWYVSDPDQPSRECWLWGRYAEVRGEVTAVPVFTPPPTPTPSFVWDGHWDVWVAGSPASMELDQSGSLITGRLIGPGTSYSINGTTAEQGREVNGDLRRESNQELVATFSWRMLDNLEQFIGSYAVIPPATFVGAWCGARGSAGQPSPCVWP